MGETILIWFGDGLQAKYYDEKMPQPNRDGQETQEILLCPEEAIIDKYNLTDEDLRYETEDSKHACWKEYPTNQMIWLNRSKGSATLFIFTGFNGNDSPMTNKFQKMLEEIQSLEEMVNLLKIKCSTLMTELKEALTEQCEVLRKQKEYADIVSETAKEEEEND